MIIRFHLAILLGTLLIALPAFAQRSESKVNLPSLGKDCILDVTVSRLTSDPDKPEVYSPINNLKEAGLELEGKSSKLGADAVALRYTLRNNTDKRMLLKISASAAIPLENYTWWNGYAEKPTERFEGDSLLSIWFPASAAIGKDRAFVLGLNPRDLYSRVESFRNKDTLVIDIPLVAEPHSSSEASFIVSACSARYGYRDVVQHYYDLFPEAYRPAEGISDSVISTQTTYLFWKPANYAVSVASDLIRRYTDGKGGWEWCYAPFLRGGDWATTYQWTKGFNKNTEQSIDQHRAKTKERFAPAANIDVAPMYYVNVMWSDKSLMEEHFPEALANPIERKSFGQPAYVGLYPWGNRYGELFVQSLKEIARDFPMTRGIGWDSAFGHIVIDEAVAGVKETPEKSHLNGRVFVLNGVGIAHLLDLNHSLESEGFRRANAVNLKLVSPYFLGSRADAALYEGNPVEDPKRMIRFESMRARLGSPKAVSWHKHLLPDRIKWVKWSRLSPEEVGEAYRQLQDDTLFLSYFWGSIPSPGMPTLGIPRTFRAIPELIDLTRLGWQPSPAVDIPEGILAARYGKGPGARIVLINPDFENRPANVVFPYAYWDQKIPLLVRKDGEELTWSVAQDGVHASMELAPRSVVILEIAGEANPRKIGKNPIRMVSSATAPSGQPAARTFHLETLDNIHWDCRFPLEPGYKSAKLESEDISGEYTDGWMNVVVDSEAWPDDVQNLNLRRNEFTIIEEPEVAAPFDHAELQKLAWFPDEKGSPGVAIVPDSSKGDANSGEVERISDWFRFYSENCLKAPFAPKTEEASRDSSPAIILRFNSEDKTLAPGGRIELEGNSIVLTAGSEAGMKKTVLRFLGMMDQAFPYYGVIPTKRDDEELARAGLLGGVLDAKIKSDFILKPTLSERMKAVSLLK